MFVSSEVMDCLNTLWGWRDHYDLNEIPALGAGLNASDSGEFMQDVHPALRLDIIQQSIPSNRSLVEYLETTRNASVTELLNQVVIEKGWQKYAKKTLADHVIFDSYGWSSDAIISRSRFVGFKIKPVLTTGLKISLKDIAVQFTADQVARKIYVYHSSKKAAIQEIDLVTASSTEWKWLDKQVELLSIGKEYAGGVFFIGYYQDEVDGQAINSDYDWDNGPCRSCDGGKRFDIWMDISKYVDICPIYVPGPSLPTVGEMFDVRDSVEVYDTNWGMNFKISAECDLSTFFCEHKMDLKQSLGLKMAHNILKDMKHSVQLNYIEEQIKNMIIRDLEGDTDTNFVNVADQLQKSIEAMNFDQNKRSAFCLPCQSKGGARYGVA